MNITNLQRDSIWTKLSSAGVIGWSTQSNLFNAQFTQSGDPTVYNMTANVQSSNATQVAILGDNTVGVGVYMKPPSELDTSPYRVIAHAHSTEGDYRFMIGVGYAPATITGNSDSIEEALYIPFEGSFDGVIMLPKVDSQHTYFGRAIGFAVLASDGGALGLDYLLAHLSVQNLSTSPPAFAQSTS